MCHVVREIIHFWNANTFLERQYIFGTPVWNWLHEMCHVIRAMRRDCNCQLVNRQICLHTFWLTRETKLLHAKCAIDYTKCVMWSVWNWHEMCDVELMNWHEMCELTRNVWIDTKCVNWHEMCELTRNVWIDTKCVNFSYSGHIHTYTLTHTMCDRLHSHTHVCVCVTDSTHIHTYTYVCMVTQCVMSLQCVTSRVREVTHQSTRWSGEGLGLEVVTYYLKRVYSVSSDFSRSEWESPR